MHTHHGMPSQTFLVTVSDKHGVTQIGVVTPCLCDMADWVTDNQILLELVDPEIVEIFMVTSAPVVF